MKNIVDYQPKIGEDGSGSTQRLTATPTLTTPASEEQEVAESDSTPGKAPAFQFYPRDFLTDPNVITMSLPERGAYITLICLAWHNPIPSDLDRLARLCGVSVPAMRKLWPALARCFRPHPDEADMLIHPRLEREREKQADYRRRQSDKGRASGAARRTKREPGANRGSTERQPEPNSGSPSVEPRPVATETKSSSSVFDLQSSDSSQERARPRGSGVGHGALAGYLPADHRACYGSFCERICLSAKQHALFLARFGGDEAEAERRLDAFYAEVRSSLTPGVPVGDKPWDFWQAQFAAKFGTVASGQNSKTAGNAAAVARFIARGGGR